jgi:LPS O-antigen subunit length determinant protein (WzzB/FepE family)
MNAMNEHNTDNKTSPQSSPPAPSTKEGHGSPPPGCAPVYPVPYDAEDEIDLFELFQTLWQGRWTIVAVTFLFAVAGVAYALLSPNIYKAEALLAPVETEQSPRIGGQLGALVGMAGGSVGSGAGSQAVLAKEILRSRNFLGDFIERHQLAPQLAAVEGWDASTGEWIYDTEMYNPQTGEWGVDDEGKSLEPSEWDLVRSFRDRMSISEDRDTAMVTVSVSSQNPIAARDWVQWLVRDVNEMMRQRDIAEAQQRIEYLENKIKETSISGMQQVFFQLIENETRSVMLANVQPEYVFKTVDPAVVPEEKSEPKRALIAILATMAGGMIAVLIVFVRTAIKNRKEA